MLPIRKKTVTLDGADFVISPLTHRAASDLAAKEKDADVRLEAIVFSLNRASDLAVTVEQLREELDPFTTQTLFVEILKFSGLKTVDPTVGEAPAPA